MRVLRISLPISLPISLRISLILSFLLCASLSFPSRAPGADELDRGFEKTSRSANPVVNPSPADTPAPASAAPQAGPRKQRLTPEELDRQLEMEIRAVNPAAADTFALANEARTAERHEEAAALYGRVIQMAPRFDHALRRQGYEFLALGRKREALDRMTRALSIKESAMNLQGMATALITPQEKETPSQRELEYAAQLLRKALILEPGDPQLASLACWVALQTQDVEWLTTESERFERLDPQNPWPYYFQSICNAMSGDRKGAERRLEKARILGLPDAPYQDLHDMLEKSRSPIVRHAGLGGLVLGGWLAGFLVILALGTLLSRAALTASRRLPKEESGRARGLDAALRKLYGAVLWFSCAYYYISIPLVLAVVLLTGGGLVYGMLRIGIGHIPIKLLLIVVILTFVTLGAVLKSILVRGRDEDPGLKAEPGEHPRLRQVLADVAARIATRGVSNVYLTPGTEIAVMERGGLFKQLNGHSERCLILGIGALEGMRMRPFRAILAHEYGHFSNRDTAGGGFALAVRRSLVATAFNLARGGAAAWFNPAWLFVNGFYRLFLLVSHGASRLQEVLADRWAAFSYGGAAFKVGLRHVIDRSIRFDAHANSVLSEVVRENKGLSNLYTYRPSTPPVEEEKLTLALEASINRKPSAYDSHPCPADRFALVDALGTTGGPVEPDDEREAWSLFDNRETLEKRLTDQVRENLREAQGFVIPGEE